MPDTQAELLPVTDVDICLDPGLNELHFTLWPEDALTIDEKDDIHLVFKHPVPGRPVETILVRGMFVRWLSKRSAMRALPTQAVIDMFLEEFKRRQQAS